MAIDEGYIKFNLEWEKKKPFHNKALFSLIEYRNKCFKKGFIGVYKELGIGFGNISFRYKNTNQFIISGTQTGHIEKATEHHFCLVTKTDISKNKVVCQGPVKASAESLTHDAFYKLDKNIKAVIHIHHREMWQQLLYKIPTTKDSIPYGTVEMVQGILKLHEISNLPTVKILAMAGHQDGIISFGKTLDAAFRTLLHYQALP